MTSISIDQRMFADIGKVLVYGSIEAKNRGALFGAYYDEEHGNLLLRIGIKKEDKLFEIHFMITMTELSSITDASLFIDAVFVKLDEEVNAKRS